MAKAFVAMVGFQPLRQYPLCQYLNTMGRFHAAAASYHMRASLALAEQCVREQRRENDPSHSGLRGVSAPSPRSDQVETEADLKNFHAAPCEVSHTKPLGGVAPQARRTAPTLRPTLPQNRGAKTFRSQISFEFGLIWNRFDLIQINLI